MNYVLQVGGRTLDLLDPWQHQFSLKDAVKAISRTPRFSGHTTSFYSVAQHCVIVSVLCPLRPWDGLAHDLEEAYIGDIPSPQKRLMETLAPLYAARLRNVSMAVESAFLCSGTSHAEVKKADLIALATERRDLLPTLVPPNASVWGELPPAADYTVVPLPPEEAEKAWWKRYHQLVLLGKAPASVLAS